MMFYIAYFKDIIAIVVFAAAVIITIEVVFVIAGTIGVITNVIAIDVAIIVISGIIFFLRILVIIATIFIFVSFRRLNLRASDLTYRIIIIMLTSQQLDVRDLRSR